MDLAIFQQLAVAIALGSLIGLERERRHQITGEESFGVIRTFALVSLTGALAYAISDYSMAFFAVISGGFLALLTASYVLANKNRSFVGATSEVAAIIVYMLGILSAMEQYVLATSIALAVLVILHFKSVLHRWVKNIKNEEIVSTIQFLLIT